MITPSKLQEYEQLLGKYLPANAVKPIIQFVLDNKIFFKIMPPRSSKLGDYSAPTPSMPMHRITVNGDLSKAEFMWVTLHEMAHFQTKKQYPRRVKPHGIEWQRNFADNIRQYLQLDCFPHDSLPAIRQYIAKLPLSPSANDRVMLSFRQGAQQQSATPVITPNNLQPGDCFALQGRTFQIVEKKRTRYSCLCLENRQMYSISATASVQPLKKS